MKIQSLSNLWSYRLGAGLLLALSFTSCTEESKGGAPTPIPTPPTPPVTTASNEEAKDYKDYTELVWNDEFDGGALDQKKWGYDLGGGGWGNNEKQAYTNSTGNVYLSGGNLVIQASQQQNGNNAYTSGRILTKGKQSFMFGRIDVRAKLPKGRGIWPAIWMLGADIDQNNWPKCGEIDIMELRGSQPKELLSTMHFAKADGNREYKGTTYTNPDPLSDDFHVYSVVRSKDLMRFFLDGQLYYTFTSSSVGTGAYPFNNPFFLILNVAVGGDFDGDPVPATLFPQQMQVDYVKYFQYK
jgi:beta-glucanase (GH16 family)